MVVVTGQLPRLVMGIPAHIRAPSNLLEGAVRVDCVLKIYS